MENLQNKINWILQEKYDGKLTAKSKKDIDKLKKGEPLDYIIGFIEFLGCKIDLLKKPLIPRPETEFWVERAVSEINNRKPFGTAKGKINNKLFILDMFAGSGCIGIAVLKHIKNSHVVFADQGKDCLNQIKVNLELNNINKKRFEIIRSDIFSNLNHKSEIINLKSLSFDYIFANPPYISTERKHKVQESVLKHEPHGALFGGKDGLFYIKKFLALAKNFLNPGGKIYMEFDSIQKNDIANLLKINGYKEFKIRKDQFGKWRYCVARIAQEKRAVKDYAPLSAD